MRTEGKQTRHDNRISVFQTAISVADFQRTIASVVRAANRSAYNLLNHCSLLVTGFLFFY